MSRSWSLKPCGLSVADQSAQWILPWRSERSRSLGIIVALPPSSSPDWLSRLLLLLVSTSQLLIMSILLYMYFYIFFTLCDNHILVLFCWNVYYYCTSILWFLPVLMLSVYMWRYFRPAYIRRSDVSVPVGSGRHIVLEVMHTNVPHFCFERFQLVNCFINNHRSIHHLSTRNSFPEDLHHFPQSLPLPPTAAAGAAAASTATEWLLRPSGLQPLSRAQGTRRTTTSPVAQSSPCAPCWAVDRPVDRLKVPNSRLGTVDRHGRPVHMVGRPTGRPTVGSGCFAELEIYLYLRADF